MMMVIVMMMMVMMVNGSERSWWLSVSSCEDPYVALEKSLNLSDIPAELATPESSAGFVVAESRVSSHADCSCVPVAECPEVARTTARCVDGAICCSNQYTPKCGRSDVFSSVQTEKHTNVPWMASILRPITQGYLVICAASLFHRQMAITSARCFDNLRREQISSLVVRLGDYDLLSDESDTVQQIQVAEIVSHEDYDPVQKINDLAIVVLKNPARLGKNVDTICLRDHVEINERCFATSYGIRRGSYQDQGISSLPQDRDLSLKTVGQTLVDFNQCQNLIRERSKGRQFLLHSSFFCAKSDDEDDEGVAEKEVCDLERSRTGSPITCQDPISGEHQLLGFVSWGMGCWNEFRPGVHTNVSMFSSWLQRQVDARLGYSQV